jgi:hypothetical protein
VRLSTVSQRGQRESLREFDAETRRKWEETGMKKLSVALLGAVLVCTSLVSLVTPADALGGCGPNRHRNAWGHCVFGGQNQDWCIRRTGHPAVRAPNGNLVCR